ncbi:phosphoribosylglycinamide formyltransferase [Lysobacter bugurensis]|uniref:Phosphoribosylglycinamide formyltransferase n=1 Tax=Cognatilysobacter bugurensis TaxID=543356 RepID=A0A918SZ09_9GAMM|nr:phosphoribosylglycinamide formyltransferase [Lysobacter bugurensis]
MLASGRGSNLQALIDAIGEGRLHARIVGVFSDRRDALALQRARDAGLLAEALRARDFDTRLEFDAALFERVDAVQPDLIVCAGYMRLLGQPVVEAHRGRMLNIHPSLLPAFKGLRTHEQALAAGAPVHGASVHFVTPELDGGPVIAQARVPVRGDDDAPALAARVIAREHPLLVETLRLFAQGRVALQSEHVHLDRAPLPAPLQLDADDRLPA